MNLANDYFLLYHGISLQKELEYKTLTCTLNSETLSLFCILLIVRSKDFEKFIALDSFTSFLQTLHHEKIKSIEELYSLQCSILALIEKNNSSQNISTIHDILQSLKKENILAYDNHKKLSSLFEYSSHCTLELPALQKKEFSFQEEQKCLNECITTLKEEIFDTTLLNQLKTTSEYLHNQKFSIGITGVINAGKSTMLNALLGEELLGSSVVPETANLSIIKYSKTQEAKVFYWNKQEWNKLLTSAKEIDAMQEFVDEAHASFGDSLGEYILEESRVDSVDVKKLSDFTSAKASTKMCNLIKYVSLGCDVDFLQEGIEIVDTPGLDDPVVQREEITKEYIAKCDMMFHLMNVAQSATLKDVSFIIDALLYQNVSKLLVVITRADTVSKKELSEVINYTKESIKEELHKQNKDSKLEYILQTIEFIPISALMALLHKTGRKKEAQAAGFSLEDTGIIEIQNYLHENLFGSSSIKSELIIRSSSSQLLNIIKHQEDSLIYELSLCAKSKEELEDELQRLIQKKEKDTNTIQIIQEDIRHYKSSLDKELLSLENFLSVEFAELETLIRQRLVSDIRYSLEQTKTLPQNTRLRSITQTTIKDGVIDIVRDYRYQLIKKMTSISQLYLLKYKDFAFEFNEDLEIYDLDTLYINEFKSGFLLSNNEQLITNILAVLPSVKLKNINEFDITIKSIIQTPLQTLRDDSSKYASTLSKELIEHFCKLLRAPIESIIHKLEYNEERLQKHILNDKDFISDSLTVHKKIKTLQSIAHTLNGVL